MNKFPDNPNYVAYERLLIELHRLIAEGKGDDEEAEAVRDQMDTPWYRLSPEEDERMGGLSADLYMLQDDEIYEAYEGTQEQLRQSLSTAYHNQDYQGLLSLLRKGPKYIPQQGLASLRAIAYQELGHLDAALVFLRYALSHTTELGLAFDREWFQTQIVDLLMRLNRYDDAIAEVEASINYFTFQDFRFIAAHALVLCAEHVDGRTALSLYRRAAAVIESILDDPAERKKLSPSLLSTAFQVLGDCYRSSGQPQKAEAAHASAIRAVSDTILQARPQPQNELFFLSAAV